MGPLYPFDCGVEPGHLCSLPGDEALAQNGVRRGLAVFPVPDGFDRRDIMEILPVHPEDQIAPLLQLLQVGEEDRMLHRFFRFPPLEEPANRLGGGVFHRLQQPPVELDAALVAKQIPLRVLFRQAQQVGGVVPQEVGLHTHRALCPQGKGHSLGDGHQLFAPPHLLGGGQQVCQLSLFIDAEGEGDLPFFPARDGGFPPLGQNLIIACKGGEDHRCTSLWVRSSTPFFSTARKNWGWISWGLL